MVNKEEKYANLQYFIESYFNWSMDYADLENLIEEFKKRELPVYVEGLLQELKEISELGNWEEIKDFVYLHGRRNLSNNKIEQMVELLLAKLSQ